MSISKLLKTIFFFFFFWVRCKLRGTVIITRIRKADSKSGLERGKLSNLFFGPWNTTMPCQPPRQDSRKYFSNAMLSRITLQMLLLLPIDEDCLPLKTASQILLATNAKISKKANKKTKNKENKLSDN